MLPLGACGTMSRLYRSDPAPPLPQPLVISTACLADNVEPAVIEPPPIPPAIERPAGEPNATNYPGWLTYVDRRRERAELAGLFYQGERNAIRDAYNDTDIQHDECRAWAEQHR